MAVPSVERITTSSLLRRTVRLSVACLVALACTASIASAASGKTLVFGAADNGVEGNNTAATLSALGLSVDRVSTLPADLSAYSSIWYISAYDELSSDEQTRLGAFVRDGGSAYLTGERPCCDALDEGVQNVLRSVLTDQDVQVGGLGDISGPFTFNGAVADEVASEPNLLVDFVPDSPGGMAGIGGVNSRNVFASNGTTPVGAAWDESDMTSRTGRIALLMDIDWLQNADRQRVIENIQNFLDHGATCSNDGPDAGFAWTGPTPDNSPANCSTITTPATISWTTGSDAGPVTMTYNASGVTADCNITNPSGTTRLTCILTDATEGATFRVSATDPIGTASRHYRVRAFNDPRNVPPGYAVDSHWWDWPDGDADGIPTYWEQHGVWVKGRFLDLPAAGADPDHKDLFLHYDFQVGDELSDGTFDDMRAMFADAPLTNPDGADGVTLHVQRGASIPASIVGAFTLSAPNIQKVTTYSGFANSPEFGGGGVPRIYHWMLNFHSTGSNVIGRSIIHSTLGFTADPVSAWEAALSVGAAPGPAHDLAEASNSAHELGHQLGLDHHGAHATPTIDPNYKSIMSYSYSNFGLPAGFGHIKHHIDYSRTSDVNLDWQTGQQLGKLTFVPGQWGEQPNFYATSNDESIDVSGEQPVEPTAAQVIQSADPDSLQGFISEFGLSATPSIPTLTGADATVDAGQTVHIDLHGQDPQGAPLSYVVDAGPALGTVTSAGSGIDYSAHSDATGEDVLEVRAVNATFGSAQVAVTVHVLPTSEVASPTTSAQSSGSKTTSTKARLAKLTKATLTRLKGHTGARARFAKITVRTLDATGLTVRVTRLPSKPCKKPDGKCPKPAHVATLHIKLRAAQTTITVTLKGRRVPRGRYTVELTPTSAAGAGSVISRHLTVRG